MKKIIKILSIIMAVLMFFGVFSVSTTVFAEEYNQYVENKAYKQKLLTETVDNGIRKAEIICEVAEKREEFSKTYLRADGSYTKVLSNTPLHIKKNHKWEDIDNRLVAKDDTIKNNNGKFEIEFPETITENDKITVGNGKESIAFSVNDIKSSDGAISAIPTENVDAIAKDLSKTVSGITYEDIEENTDVQYIVSPVSVKENIIVHDKKSLKETYSFDIEKGDLTATLDSEKNLLFKNSKNKTVFVIPAPVMTDRNNDISYDIDIAVENSEAETLTLTYTPSKEWLNASDRVYPVVIDPVISLPDADDVLIQDTVIIDDNSDATKRNTNYSNSAEGIISDNSTYKGNVLVKLNMDAFSGFKQADIEITDVNYFGEGYIIGGNALVKPIIGEWDCETITYDDVFPSNSTETSSIAYENKVIDYYTGMPADTVAPESTSLHFNITSLFKEWLKGNRENDGFAIVPENSSTYGVFFLAGEYTPSNNTYTFNTYCSIDYVDTSGNNDSYEYLTQEIGRAGTANVNTFSRSLSLTRSDISMDGLLMPVSVGFNYNSSFHSYMEVYNSIGGLVDADVIQLPYGKNWLPSYFQMIVEITDGQLQYFTGEGTIVTFNKNVEIITDEETGETTKNVTFETDETSDEGYELELIDKSEYPFFENLRITTPSGEFVHFNEDGFIIEIVEPEANSDGSSDRITVVCSEEIPYGIDYITDGVGRKYDFIYNDATGLLSEITCLTSGGVQIKAGSTESDLTVRYNYNENGELVNVTYPDGNSVVYDYESGNLTRATNIDGYHISYSYDTLNKVTMISEKSGSTAGNFITLTEVDNRQVKITDDYYGTELHQFGNDGKLQYIFDDKGNYSKSENAQSNDDSVDTVYGWDIQAENLLKNGSFENVSDSKAVSWTNSFNVTNLTGTEKPTDYACNVIGTTQQTQTVDVNGGRDYTFSVYAKDCSDSETENRGFDIQITAKDSDGNSVTKTQRIVPTTDFEQYSVSVSSDKDISLVTVGFGGSETVGAFSVNNVQLESGKGTAEFNYIENGAFRFLTDNSPDDWSAAEIVSKTLNNECINAIVLNGGLPYYTQSGTEYILNDSVSAVTQNIKINGKKGDVYSVGGWFNGVFDDNYINSIAYDGFVDIYPQLTNSSAQIKVTYSYTETVTDDAGDETEQTVTESFAVDFQPHNKGWQYAVDSFALKGDAETVDVTVITKNIISDSYATKLELTKDSESSIIEEEETEEEVSEELCSCGCEECAYGENCPCTGAVDEKCQCPECLREDTSTEDIFGNTLSNKSFDGINYIETLSSYTSDGNYSATFTDENGNVTTYDYNTLNGILKSITSPVGVGTDTTTTSYTYDAMGNVLTVSTDVSNTEKQTLQYVYNNDLLTEIITPNGKYEIIYDVWGQVLSVSIIVTNNDIETKIPLVQYTYNSGAKRTQILTATYTNSSTNNNVYAYTYDDSGNIVNIKLNNSDKHIITYDNLGGLTEIKNVGGRTVQYSDDGVKIYDPDGNLIYQSLIGETGLEAEENYGISYRELEGEHKYDAGTGSSTDISGIEIAEEYRIKQEAETDWFGREASHVTTIYDISEESDVNPAEVKGKISTEYEYPEADGGKTSSTLEKYVNKTYNGSGTDVHIFDGYYYEYDKQNKISAEKTLNADGTTTDKYSYEYDKLGQLVRFNDAIENKTYIYSYDSNGNILSKTEYAYTLSDELGTATNTTTYGYDTQWKDKLVSVGDQTITYDNIGNPTSYLGATLTWEGRNLSSYEDETRTVQYEYDENGMRYRATVTNKEDGQGGSFEYVWVDGKLISTVFVSDGSTQTAKYLYNDFDEPVGMVVTNEDKTFSTYYYLKNAQGDITNIVSAYGGKMVEFTYDAFGNQSVHYQSNPSTMVGIVLRAEQIIVHALTPFGYRGYCYDQHTGLYYLQSRYYDPTTGRFINADDTNYLNATGTVLGCNLFAYCENDPVNNVDPKGTVSFSLVKKYISNLLSKLRQGFFDYIKSLFVVENGNLKISTDVISVVINIAIKIFLARKVAQAMNIFLKSIVKPYLSNHKWKAAKFMINVIDFLLNNRFGKFIIRRIASAFVKMRGIKSKLLNTIFEGMLLNLINIKSKFIKKVAIVLGAFSSIGNFIAFIFFDLVDGQIDGYMTLKPRGFIVI